VTPLPTDAFVAPAHVIVDGLAGHGFEALGMVLVVMLAGFSIVILSLALMGASLAFRR